MKQQVTTGIVLRRTDYGEADKIVLVLTSTAGKVSLYVRGARKPKSKLAGGIELFTVAEYTFLPGKGQLSTLASARMSEQFHDILQDYDATMYAYALLKAVNAITEDSAGEEYFAFLHSALQGLSSAAVSLDTVQLWASMQLLVLSSSTPNLSTDVQGEQLQEDAKYRFDVSAMSFIIADDGRFSSQHIKVLRLCIGAKTPAVVVRVRADQSVLSECRDIARYMASENLHLEL